MTYCDKFGAAYAEDKGKPGEVTCCDVFDDHICPMSLGAKRLCVYNVTKIHPPLLQFRKN